MSAAPHTASMPGPNLPGQILPGPILAIDTATSTAVVAVGDRDGALLGAASWPAGHRHVEELVPQIDTLLREVGIAPASLGAVAVGTGPGGFTGLRVGLATAKALVDALGIPFVALPSGRLLLEAAARVEGTSAGALTLLLPAGLADRVVVDADGARIARGGADGLPAEGGGRRVLAIDLDGRAPEEALELGRAALAALPAVLIEAAASCLREGRVDDPAAVVPEYVTLPRGIEQPAGEVSVSSEVA
jgi:hypothetical protein